MAIAAGSKVFLVAFSKVRMPRSHMMTSGFPSFIIYSAAMIHSSTVALMPRFKSTGLPLRPAAFRRATFCMFLAPIWSISTYFVYFSMSFSLMISETTGMP